MARTRTRKAKVEEVEETTVDTSVSKAPVLKRTHFTVRLMQGTTYELFGMVFRRDVNQSVPMKYYEAFKKNGWFQIV